MKMCLKQTCLSPNTTYSNSPTHCWLGCPVLNLNSSGFLCPVILFLPHDPDALFHSVTFLFSVSPFWSALLCIEVCHFTMLLFLLLMLQADIRSVHMQSEVEQTPASSFSSASTTAQSPLSSNIQPSNLFQSSKPYSRGSPHPPNILLLGPWVLFSPQLLVMYLLPGLQAALR